MIQSERCPVVSNAAITTLRHYWQIQGKCAM
jgi:hypothetical protein